MLTSDASASRKAQAVASVRVEIPGTAPVAQSARSLEMYLHGGTTLKAYKKESLSVRFLVARAK
jgi:hypothetical protein